MGLLHADPVREDFLEKSDETLSYKDAKEETLKRFNAAYIGRVLAKCQGNITQADKICGMERQALQQIIRRYGIHASIYREE